MKRAGMGEAQRDDGGGYNGNRPHQGGGVKAGVVAYLEGIRAFIPASQITSAYVEDTESWVGKEIPVRSSRWMRSEKLVLSGKAVALEAEAEERNHKISMIVPGTVLEGNCREPDAVRRIY